MNERDPFASLKAVPCAKGEGEVREPQPQPPRGLCGLFSGAWSATQEELEQAPARVAQVEVDQPESQAEVLVRGASEILVSCCGSRLVIRVLK